MFSVRKFTFILHSREVVRAVVIMSGFKELRLQGFENPLNIFIRFNRKRRMEVLGKDFNNGWPKRHQWRGCSPGFSEGCLSQLCGRCAQWMANMQCVMQWFVIEPSLSWFAISCTLSPVLHGAPWDNHRSWYWSILCTECQKMIRGWLRKLC